MAEVAETIPVLAQLAASEGPRWTRAVGSISATPFSKGSLAAALLNSLFEHPAKIFFYGVLFARAFRISMTVLASRPDAVNSSSVAAAMFARLPYCLSRRARLISPMPIT